MNISLPAVIVTRERHLIDAFQQEAERLGIPAATSEKWFRALPNDVKCAPAFDWIIDTRPHYEFGSPLDIARDGFGIGSPQMPPVEWLVKAVAVANEILSPSEQIAFRGRLADRPRHQDALVEMVAVFGLRGKIRPLYEPPGEGTGARSIDWLATGLPEGDFLVEVKNRVGPLAKEMERIRPHAEAGLSGIPGPPPTDFNGLFRDTGDKFKLRVDSNRTQGALLFLNLKVPLKELHHYFIDILSDRLDFVGLTTNGAGFHIEADSPGTNTRVLSAFQFTESDDAIFTGPWPINL